MISQRGRFLRHPLPIAYALIAFLLSNPGAGLGSPTHAVVVCTNDEQGLIRTIEEIPIPVGCLLPGCCENCNERTTVDWRITIDRNLIKRANLRFEGLSQEDFDRIGAGGCFSGVGRNEDRFIIKKSMTQLRRLPQTSLRPETVDESVPVGFFTPQLRRGSLSTGRETTITVAQTMIGEVVDVTNINIRIETCPRSASRADHIELLNSNPGYEAALMLDYFDNDNAECRNDEVRQALTELSFPNAAQDANCRTDVAVFSVDRKMVIDENVSGFTVNDGEKYPVGLENALNVPITFWLRKASFRQRAEADIDNANLLYLINRVGVWLEAKAYEDASTMLLGNECPTGGALPPHHIDRLNVYYVDNDDLQGVYCKSGPEMIYIGKYANLATLAHEASHALGLDTGGIGDGHVNGIVGFGDDNLMITGGDANRDTLTLGQTFRMNVHKTSLLNTLAPVGGKTLRDGEVTRDCPVPFDLQVGNATKDCPKLSPTLAMPGGP